MSEMKPADVRAVVREHYGNVGAWLPGIERFVAPATIEARKPGGSTAGGSCCEPECCP
jgi:hypothetical protein